MESRSEKYNSLSVWDVFRLVERALIPSFQRAQIHCQSPSDGEMPARNVEAMQKLKSDLRYGTDKVRNDTFRFGAPCRVHARGSV